jgi:hypothetical protein
MRTIVIVMCCCVLASVSKSGELRVRQVKGEVSVRSGVAEGWTALARGDILKPHDSIRTGPKGSAVLVIHESGGTGLSKKISVPSNVILDLSDIRELSQEDLMLSLTMERVRSSSYEWKNSDLRIPEATVVHGERPGGQKLTQSGDQGPAILQMNGTKVLFANGFYSTCALRALRIMESFPSFKEKFEHRFLLAESLERSHLNGEALNEYVALSGLKSLTPKQRSTVQTKIVSLRKEG